MVFITYFSGNCMSANAWHSIHSPSDTNTVVEKLPISNMFLQEKI